MGRTAMGVFERTVESGIKDYLPERFQDAEINISRVNKPNAIKTGLMVKLQDVNYAPTIYLDDYYDQFISGRDMDDILTDIGELIDEAYENAPIQQSFNITDYRENIFKALINAGANKEMLNDCPHRTVHDLAVVYRVEVGDYASALVSNKMMQLLGYRDAAELEAAADVYMKNNFLPEAKTMEEVLIELLGDNIDDETYSTIHESDGPTMIVITNDKKLDGAASILNKEFMDRLCAEYGELLLLPSSRHEFIALPKGQIPESDAKELVREVNRNEVPKEDKLSDNIYTYSRERGLELVKNDSEKTKSIDRDHER